VSFTQKQALTYMSVLAIHTLTEGG